MPRRTARLALYDLCSAERPAFYVRRSRGVYRLRCAASVCGAKRTAAAAAAAAGQACVGGGDEAG